MINFLIILLIFLPSISIANNSRLLEATNFEIRAILTKCPTKSEKFTKCDDQQTADGAQLFQCRDAENSEKNSTLRTNAYRTKCELEEDEKMLKNCDKKISLTLKVKNRGLTNCNAQYIILDHVFDAGTDQKLKLLNPYVLKIRQFPVFQVYDLIFENVVNSGPTERVLNKNNEGFSGCSSNTADGQQNINPSSSTCGTKFNNKNVPFSEGFCCSCGGSSSSSSKNAPSSQQEVEAQEEESSKNANFFNSGDKEDLMGYSNNNLLKDNHRRRGGQDCSNDFIPENADPKIYHDSAHCMEFSPVWYSIYRISHPEFEHSIKIQIFEKVGMGGQKICWKEVTKDGPIQIGTFTQRYSNKDGTILAYYSLNNAQVESEFSLDCKQHKLLIPEVVSNAENSKNVQYPEIAGGPQEYLVVRDSEIDSSGKSCNKAGVGYEAFANQPNKCEKPPGSCLLGNQPRKMWKHDHDLEASNKKGCYFLKNFGILPTNPIKPKSSCNGSSASTKKVQNKLLYFYYLNPIISDININFAADMNAILKPNSLAIITEVYTETLNPKRVTITAKILNSGLVSSIFYVAIGACPLDIPASFSNIQSQPVLIAPQQLHTFTLEIYCELSIQNFFCSLEVFNMKQQLIAVRRIRFQRSDRCICSFYCQCRCFNTDFFALKCSPLEIEQYHAAGFQQGMPISAQIVAFSNYDDSLSLFLHILLYCCLTLWYMGVLKALIGCWLLPVGLCGLDKVLDLPKKLNQYYESDLKMMKLVYDDEGWPVHPKTGRKVNCVAPATQFSVNLVFFFIFPLAILWNFVKHLIGSKQSHHQEVFHQDFHHHHHHNQQCQCTKSNSNKSLRKTMSKKKSKVSITSDSNRNKNINKKPSTSSRSSISNKERTNNNNNNKCFNLKKTKSSAT